MRDEIYDILEVAFLPDSTSVWSFEVDTKVGAHPSTIIYEHAYITAVFIIYE